MLKVVTIDFWNTLYDSSNGVERNALRRHSLLEEMAKFDKILTNQEFEDALKASWAYFNNIWINEHRTPSTEDTITFLWSYLNLPYEQFSINKVARVFKESLLTYPPKLIDGAVVFLEKFLNKYKFGLISDTGFTPGYLLTELMNRDKVSKYFSAYSYSDETGVSKPNPKAFLTILDKFNCKPNEALHIGDIERTDIEGANFLGMYSIRFDGDSTSNFLKQNKEKTKANHLVKRWNDVISIFEKYY